LLLFGLLFTKENIMHRYNMIARFQGGYRDMRSKTDLIIVHHAAALYKQLTGAEDVQAVANYHVNTKKWPGIGYHCCIAEEENGGPVARYDVSNSQLERAHIYGLNDRAVGVSCLTNFTGMPDQKWIDGLAVVVGEWAERWPKARIMGHGEVALPGHGTLCPGPRWHDWKPTLLRLVNKPLLSVAYQILDHLSDDPSDNFAAVRQGPGKGFAEANINGVPYRLLPRSIWSFDDVTGQWAHLESGMGFVNMSLMKVAPLADPAQGDDITILAAPRISRGQFILNLKESSSPALAAGDDMYSLCLAYDVDPAAFEAIFNHESEMGKTGICATYQTHSPSNARTPWSAVLGEIFSVPERGNYTKYPNWKAGAEDMCKRLRGRYVAQGLDTIRKIIPVWAPKTDSNNPERYIAAVLRDVRAWQKADQQ
jgi:hypothetical protein